MPAWLTWLAAFPRYTRHPRGLIDALHRRKAVLLKWGVLGLVILPEVIALLHLIGWTPAWMQSLLGGLLCFGVPLLVGVGSLIFLFSLLVSGKQRRLARWRKRLAALFTMRHGPIPGGIEALMQDDDLFALHVQQFLAEHQTPCYVPLYDDQGRYLFACPEKVTVLARAIVQSAVRGRDNELYVLMADLLELDGGSGPVAASAARGPGASSSGTRRLSLAARRAASRRGPTPA